MSVKMKAGKYWLADPCYVLDEGKIPGFDWARDFSNPVFGGNPTITEATCQVTINGHVCVAFNTDLGDGTYMSSHGHALGVDSGSIGLVPVELVDSKDADMVEFPEDFECWDDYGVLHFGGIIVDTVCDEVEDLCPYCQYDIYDCRCEDSEEE